MSYILNYKLTRTKHKYVGTILLIHGYCSSMEQWKFYIPFFLKKGYDCLLIDLPGFGKSPRPKAKYTMDMITGYVIRTIEKIDEYRKEIVWHGIGFSFGGIVVLNVQSKMKLFNKIICISTPIYIDNYPLKNITKRCQVKVVNTMINKYYSGDVTYRLLDLIASVLNRSIYNLIVSANPDPNAVKSILNDVILHPEESTVPALNCLQNNVDTIHWIHGTLDKFCSKSHAKKVCKKYPTLIRLYLYRCGHHPLQSIPNKVLSRIFQILDTT